jgi:molybdopterin converting factor subunit 1
MKVKVRLYARLSELAGHREIEEEVGEGLTVGDLFQALCTRYPALGDYADSLMFAVDTEYVQPSHALRAGEEVALIPPVSGGARAL